MNLTPLQRALVTVLLILAVVALAVYVFTEVIDIDLDGGNDRGGMSSVTQTLRPPAA